MPEHLEIRAPRNKLRRKEMTKDAVYDEQHRNEVLSKLAHQQREGVLCDVVLVISDREVPAHRSILAASSEYFFALFTTTMMEKNCSTVQLDLCPAIVQDLLDYMYTGLVTLNESNVKELIMAADYLLISGLKQKAMEYLRDLVSKSNCIQLYTFAVLCNSGELKLAATKVICDNFSLVSSTNEFRELDFALLLDLVSNDGIVVLREEEVYEAVLRWVRQDVETRRFYFDKLFSKVRLFSMSKEYIMDHIRSEPLVNESAACMELLIQGLVTFTIQDCNRLCSGDLKPRKCLEKEARAIVLTGGLSGGKSLSSAMAYFPERKTWHHLADMTSHCNEHTVVACGNFLYCIGGYPRGNHVQCFDPLTNKWSQVADLIQRTFAPASVAFDDTIYVFGGKDGFQPLNTVQCYHPSNNNWSLGPAMKHARKALCAVAFQDDVYVIGGCFNDNYSLNIVEKLNLTTQRWTDVSPMAQERKYACAALIGDKILVIGGFQHKSSSALGSCEIYCPRLEQWSILADINCPRAAGGIGQANGRMYIFGGKHDRQAVNSVEWYNEETRKWIVEVDAMPFECAWFQCGVVKLRKEFMN